MLSFIADPRDTYPAGGSCGTCCCQNAQIAPGEINKVIINYVAWAAPIGGRGLTNKTMFSVDKKFGSEPTTGPVNTNYSQSSVNGAAINSNVSSGASDPNGDLLSYALVPLSGPENGILSFNSDGSYIYNPKSGFVGYDNFFFVTRAGGEEIIREVRIQSSPAAPAQPLPAQPYTSPITIDRERIHVDAKNYMISFPIEASPGLRIGDVYRLSVRQSTLDCDCNEFVHLSCYDFTVGKC